MGGKAMRRLAQQAACAECAGRLIIPRTRSDRMASQRATLKGEYVNPIPSLFARRPFWDGLSPSQRALHLMRSCLERHPTWIFTGAAGALAHGMDVPHGLNFPLRAIIERGSVPHEGPCLRFTRRAEAASEVIEGCRVAPLWMCVSDCLRGASFPMGLAVADAALRHTGVSAQDMMSHLNRRGCRRHGIQRALLIASHADARAENGGESFARALMIEEGFMLPDLQVEFADPVDPSHRFRVDQFWRLPHGGGMIGELDGKEKYRNPGMMQGGSTLGTVLDERRRESRLTLLGYPVLRYAFADLLVPARFIKLLEAAGVPRSEDASREWWGSWLRATGRLRDLPLIRPAALAGDP